MDFTKALVPNQRVQGVSGRSGVFVGYATADNGAPIAFWLPDGCAYPVRCSPRGVAAVTS